MNRFFQESVGMVDFCFSDDEFYGLTKILIMQVSVFFLSSVYYCEQEFKKCPILCIPFTLIIHKLLSPSITAGRNAYLLYLNCKGKGKAVPLQAWSGPECPRKLMFPRTAQDGGKVVSLTHRPSLPSENVPGTHFC